MPVTDLVQRWQDKLELEGKSPRTREVYLSQIQMLARWANPRPVDGLQLEDLERFLLERKRSSLGESTLGIAVCAFKSFYRRLGSPAADGLKYPAVKDRAQRVLNEEEVEAVLASIDTSTAKGKRDLAIIGLLVSTGLRAAEVCRLRLKDIDFERRIFKVVVKGGQTKEKWIDGYAVNLVLAWLAVRAEVVKPRVETLFVGMQLGQRRQGYPLTRVGIRILCNELAERAGIDHFSPHALRRTFATLATENDCPTRLLQEAGGWSDIRMVEKYTRAIQLKSFEKFSPLIRLMQKPDKGGRL
jgi:integrase